MTVDALVRPHDTEAVLDAVKAASSDSLTLEVVGAGTKRGLGRPIATDLICDLTALSGIQLYEPEELVMTALAGTPLAEIEQTLADAGQHLGFEPPDLGPVYGQDAGRQTIGGAIACNLAGPRRIMAGAARDHFLGLETVTGFGEAIKAGGRVVKNVTGYDLCKLFAGSYGTLGVLTQVTIKVLPRPAHQATMIIEGLEDAAAIALLRSMATQPFEISGAAHLPAWAVAESDIPEIRNPATSVTAMRLEGFKVSVDDRLARLTKALSRQYATRVLADEACAALWAEIRSNRPAVQRPYDHLWRLSVPPAQGAGVVDALHRQIRVDAFYDWGGGLIWCLVPGVGGVCDGPIRAAAEAVGGHATLMRAPDAARAETPVFHPVSNAKAALLARIKASFDPDGMFNPGRMYPEG